MRITKKQQVEMDKAAARQRLRLFLKPGSEVLTSLNHVSSSGMTRHISLYVCDCGDLIDITHWVSTLCGYRLAKHKGLIASGCGMDMGFSVVYNLGYAMWPKGTDVPHGTRNGETDRDCGYALKQKWI